MHVIVATDGSRQSLAAAKHLKAFADPAKLTEISVVAVIRPLASVAFADDLSESKDSWPTGSFRDAAESAVSTIAAVFDGWGPKVSTRIRSGSAANEIIKAGQAVRRGAGRGRRRRSGTDGRRAHGEHRAAGPALRAVPGPRRTPGAEGEEADPGLRTAVPEDSRTGR